MRHADMDICYGKDDTCRTVIVEYDVEREFDDDGCGSPSRTGNSMTGYRLSYLVPVIHSITDAETDEAIKDDAAYEIVYEKLREKLEDE